MLSLQGRLPETFSVPFFELDERKNLLTRNERDAAKINNDEIKQRTYRVEKFKEARDSDRKNAVVWYNLGRADLDAKDYDEAIENFTESIKLGHAAAYNGRGVAYWHRGKQDKAFADFEAVIALEKRNVQLSKATEPALREQVARAMVNKGTILGQRGDHQAAINIYNEVDARFGKATEPTLREPVASALFNKGFVLNQRGDHQAAINIYNEVDARFGKATEPTLREPVAKALFNKGATLYERGDPQAASDVFDEVDARFGKATEPMLREHVASALVNKGTILNQRGDPQAAIEAYNDVDARFGKATEPTLREHAARALVNKGISLSGRGDHQAAIDVFDDVDARFGKATEPTLREPVAKALFNKGTTLYERGDHQPAIDVFDEVDARFGKATEPTLREPVAGALVNKGFVLIQCGDHQAANDVFDDVDARFGKATEPTLREHVARALVNKGTTLYERGDPQAASDVFDEVDARFGKATEPTLREQVAGALGNKGAILNQRGDHQAAIDIFDEMDARFGKATEPTLRELVASGLKSKSQILQFLAHRALSLNQFKQGCGYYRQAMQCRQESKTAAKIDIEAHIKRYYDLDQEKDNPINGYGVPTRVISEKKLRDLISETAASIVDRLSLPDEPPFPILSKREVGAVIAYGKNNPWNDRVKRGWHYHTNAFQYVLVTYQRWVNRGLTREILAWADPALHAHLKTKISREGGLPEWLDLPSGPEARARAITDPTERAELEVFRKIQRQIQRRHVARKGLGD